MQLKRTSLQFGWINHPKAFDKALSLVLVFSLVLPYSLMAQDPSEPPMIGGVMMGKDFANPAQGELGGPDDPHAPTPAMKKAILQMPTVQGAVGAIGRLNEAMRVAAENPNDEWRREDVRKAMREVPPAVQALAGTFASHQIGNSSLPFVLSMMGGFVDQNAPNAFDKFLKNPAPDLIPKLGAEFPRGQEYKEMTTVVKEENKLSPQVVQAGATSTPVMPPAAVAPGSPQDLARILPVPITEPTSTPVRDGDRIVVKEEGSAPRTEAASVTAAPASQPEPVLNTLSRDIAIAESLVKQAQELEEALKPEKEDDFFAPKKKDKKAEERSRRPEAKTLKPTSWLLMPLFYWISTNTSAHAEPGNNNPADGGGGQGNPGDQGGGGGGNFLFGIAAIIAAVAPMVVAGIESEKEQKIATIESEAQIKQAEIQTSTQKEMAQLSSQTALAQAESSREVAKMNNDAQTQRLQINLAASQQQRNEERQFQQEQITYQRQMEAQRIALAERQAEESIRIAKETLEAKKLEAALTGVNAANNQAAAQNTKLQNAPANPLASALTRTATGGAATSANSANSGSAQGRGLIQQVPRQRGPGLGLAPSSRLLASAGDLESNPFIRGVYRRKNSRLVKSSGLAAFTARSLRSGGPLKTARSMYQSGASALVTGSFSEEKVRASRPEFKVAEVAPVIVEEAVAQPSVPVIRSH